MPYNLIPSLQNVRVEASVTAKYTGLTATPTVSGASLTITKAAAGGDSGALLTLGKRYRLAVSDTVYREGTYIENQASDLAFWIDTTVGAPGTTAITKIYEVVATEKDMSVSGILTTDGLNVKFVNVINDNYTITDETAVFVNATGGAVDITLPAITHGRILFFKQDITGTDVDYIPATGEGVNGGGANVKYTKNSDGFVVLVGDANQSVKNWVVMFVS